MCHHLINVFSEDASLFSFVNRLECVCVPQPLACRPEDPAGAETGVCALGGGAAFVVAFHVLLQGSRRTTFPSPLLVSLSGALPSRGGLLLLGAGESGSSSLPRLPVRGAGCSGQLLSLPGDQGRLWNPTPRQSPALRFLSNVSTRKQKGAQRGPRRRTMNYSSQRLLFPS